MIFCSDQNVISSAELSPHQHRSFAGDKWVAMKIPLLLAFSTFNLFPPFSKSHKFHFGSVHLKERQGIHSFVFASLKSKLMQEQ